MKYRAILVDNSNQLQERPMEIFGDSLPEILRWTDIMLDKATSPTAIVNIYESVEQKIRMVLKPQPKPESKTP